MTEPAIRVENISKLYRLGTIKPVHDSLREVLTSVLGSPLRRFYSNNGQPHNSQLNVSTPEGKKPWVNSPVEDLFPSVDESGVMCALNDVSFDVQYGEVLGIIGRNGAGKSTLLKILSRITEPSSGRAVLMGRVASLLEVGTGFHAELTGRENIYLNGAILGLRKREIDRLFDEIVAFAEIDKFLDTPVKRYSSGMYTRLAFAVAAHLQPEILIVDEVLAVGDTSFQKKCLGKMSEVAKAGRTVLFVSHNMDAIINLCTRCVFLRQGRIAYEGRPDEAVSEYLSYGSEFNSSFTIDYENMPFPDGPCHLIGGEVTHVAGETTEAGRSQTLRFSDPWEVRIRFRYLERCTDVTAGMRISDDKGRVVLNTGEFLDSRVRLERVAGEYEAVCSMPAGLLLPGNYVLDVALDYLNGPCIQVVFSAAKFKIVNDYRALREFRKGKVEGVIGCLMTPWRTVNRTTGIKGDVHAVPGRNTGT